MLWRSLCTAAFDWTIRVIFSQKWYIAVGLLLLLGFGLIAWQFLRPDIIRQTTATIRKLRSKKAKAKQILRSLPRIGLGLGGVVATVWVSWVFAYGLYMQIVVNRMTKTQRTCLIMAYLAYREQQIGNCNMVIMGALAEQARYLDTLPKHLRGILMTYSKESLISAGLLADTPYRLLDNPVTGEEDAKNTELKIAPMGIRVVEYLVQRDPSLPLRI